MPSGSSNSSSVIACGGQAPWLSAAVTTCNNTLVRLCPGSRGCHNPHHHGSARRGYLTVCCVKHCAACRARGLHACAPRVLTCSPMRCPTCPGVPAQHACGGDHQVHLQPRHEHRWVSMLCRKLRGRCETICAVIAQTQQGGCASAWVCETSWSMLALVGHQVYVQPQPMRLLSSAWQHTFSHGINVGGLACRASS